MGETTAPRGATSGGCTHPFGGAGPGCVDGSLAAARSPLPQPHHPSAQRLEVARVAALTARERDVSGLLGAGLSNAEIAGRLHLVEGTVKMHVSAILRRMGVRNRVRAAILAHEAGLIDTPDRTDRGTG